MRRMVLTAWDCLIVSHYYMYDYGYGYHYGYGYGYNYGYIQILYYKSVSYSVSGRPYSLYD